MLGFFYIKWSIIVISWTVFRNFLVSITFIYALVSMQTTHVTLIAVSAYTVHFWWKIIIKEYIWMFLKHCLLFIKNVYFLLCITKQKVNQSDEINAVTTDADQLYTSIFMHFTIQITIEKIWYFFTMVIITLEETKPLQKCIWIIVDIKK